MSTSTTKLDQQTIELVKATVPIIEERGDEITSRFYQMMFENHPELKKIFNQTNQRKGDQSKALANTIYAAAANIDQLETILPAVMPITEKHRSLNIKPEHYPIVGKHLLLAMRDVLGEEVATDAIIDAWGNAYNEIANVFISIESNMYQDVKDTVGGWLDYRDFKVTKKVKESEVITSFYLEPVDNNPFPAFKPGQYITVKAENIPGESHAHLRQYSLSCAPNKGVYRISVKREDSIGDNPAGIMSNYLHSCIEEGSILPISAPAGDFFLDVDDDRPLVLMSGGVGLTPMMSMLETVIHTQPERKVIFIHATQNGKVHAMREQVNEITKNHPVKIYTLYDNPEKEDEGNFNKTGFIDYEWLTSVLPTNNVATYFCGPKPFMQAAYKYLKEFNVDEADIHFEFFGPAQEILN